MLDRLPRELQEHVVSRMDPASRRALRGVSAAMRDLATVEAEMEFARAVHDMTFVLTDSGASPQSIAIAPLQTYDSRQLAEFMKRALEAVMATAGPAVRLGEGAPHLSFVELRVSTAAVRRAAELVVRAVYVQRRFFVQQGSAVGQPRSFDPALTLSVRYGGSRREVIVGVQHPRRAWVSITGRHRDAASVALVGMMLHAWSGVVKPRDHACTLWLPAPGAVADEVPAMLRAMFATVDTLVAA